jgi:hypothetical protein
MALEHWEGGKKDHRDTSKRLTPELDLNKEE